MSRQSLLKFTLVILVFWNLAPLASAQPATAPATRPSDRQDALEARFVAMLSNATLEGSFTSTNPGRDPKQLSSDSYQLGPVRKLGGNSWVINAKFGAGEKAAMIPLVLPIEWAGDTPVIVVDNMTLLGVGGPYSARVMFFDNHYTGYWKHGERGGLLFGVVKPQSTTQPVGR